MLITLIGLPLTSSVLKRFTYFQAAVGLVSSLGTGVVTLPLFIFPSMHIYNEFQRVVAKQPVGL